MNPIIAICDFTAYPALKGEKLFLEQKLESIQQEKRDLYHPSAIQYDSESGHSQNRKAIFGCTRDQQLWEATYNGDKDETYIDRYQKFSNWVLKEVAND